MEREMPLPLNLQHSMKQSVMKILTLNASCYQYVSCAWSSPINPTTATHAIVSQCTEDLQSDCESLLFLKPCYSFQII